MPRTLEGRRIAVLAADGVGQSELESLLGAIGDAGAEAVLVSPEAQAVQAYDGEAPGKRFDVGVSLADAHAATFSGLVLPGGAASAEALRSDARAVQLVREFMAAEKPVAAVAEGTLLLAAADMLEGRRVTGPPGLRSALVDAGGEWVDRPVVVDERLVTGRGADGSAAFMDSLPGVLGSGTQERALEQWSEQSFPASDAPPGPISIGPRGGSGGERRTS